MTPPFPAAFPAPAASSPRVTGLFVYPIKACGGVAVQAATVEPMGLRHDRRFMIVHDENGAHAPGRFLTQREYPRLALVAPSVADNGNGADDGGTLVLCAPNHADLAVSWTNDKLGNVATQTRAVSVWRDTVHADDMGDECAAWLSEFVQTPVRLVRAGRAFRRPVQAGAGDVVSFADGFPVLLAAEESLADLNDRLTQRSAEPVPMSRFRANIVVQTGAAPFAEDSWRTVQIGSGASFRVAKPCARCAVITVDQSRGEKTGAEPLATLAAYRRDKETGGVLFAVNLLPDVTPATVHVGDTMRPDF